MIDSTTHTIAAFPVAIRAGTSVIRADLTLPDDARGIVLFAHGSGSSRFSARNRAIAASLQLARFGTLLVDLLTADEEATDAHTGQHRFDIEMLTRRVVAATDWLAHDPRTRVLPIGYFGASTGTAAALLAAVRRPGHVRAIVSRGGRPDLAGASLRAVRVPTLLIVGAHDTQLLAYNRFAQRKLMPPSTVVSVPGATHQFEEPGALDVVMSAARNWFDRYLCGSPVAAASGGW